MLTFESFTAAIRIQLRVPVNVTTFGGIGLIAGGLGQVESQRKKSRLPPPNARFPKNRGYELLSFEVRSPPVVSVLADPSWLAVYIGLLALGVSCLQLLGSYSSVKNGAKELASDLGKLKNLTQREVGFAVGALRQLTDAQRSELVIGASLFIDEAQRTGNEIEKLLLGATRFASILTRKTTSPHLEVNSEVNRPNDG